MCCLYRTRDTVIGVCHGSRRARALLVEQLGNEEYLTNLIRSAGLVASSQRSADVGCTAQSAST